MRATLCLLALLALTLPREAAADPADAEILRTGIAGIDRVYHLSPILGVGWTTESGVEEPARYFTVGLALEVRPSLDHALLLSFSTSAYRRIYVEDRIDPARGGLGRTAVDERKWNVEGLYAYDLLESFDPDRRVAGELLGGVVLRAFDNIAHPQNVAALSVGFRFGVAVTRYFDLTAHLLYGYNLVPPSSSFTSFNGEPRSLLTYSGALGFRFAAHSRVRLGYSGESLPLGRTYRHYHGVQLAYDVGF